MGDIGERARSAVDELAAVCGEDVGRGIGPLVKETRGDLLAAAASIATHVQPRVVVITGFYIPRGTPPAAETDGPVGMAQLVHGFNAVGIPAEAVTDRRCLTACQAALSEVSLGSKCSAVDLASREDVDRILATWKASNPPVSHLISIERVGPAYDGVPRNMKGVDISSFTAPLHQLFEADCFVRVGIGDGGNELGMGRLPRSMIAEAITLGDSIACCIGADHLIVAGVSNWGAAALLCALAVLRSEWRVALLGSAASTLHDRILRRLFQASAAVDGVTGTLGMTVDGIPLDVHRSLLERLHAVVAQYAV